MSSSSLSATTTAAPWVFPRPPTLQAGIELFRQLWLHADFDPTLTSDMAFHHWLPKHQKAAEKLVQAGKDVSYFYGRRIETSFHHGVEWSCEGYDHIHGPGTFLCAWLAAGLHSPLPRVAPTPLPSPSSCTTNMSVPNGSSSVSVASLPKVFPVMPEARVVPRAPLPLVTCVFVPCSLPMLSDTCDNCGLPRRRHANA